MSLGILDAGGRNAVIALESPAGFKKIGAIIGMTLFLQHWYWLPYQHFLSLSLTPTAVIGLNKDLVMPEGFAVICNASPSEFAYPPPMKEEAEEVKERVKTAVLSTTEKAKARERAKRKEKEGEGDEAKDSMDVVETGDAGEDGASLESKESAEGGDGDNAEGEDTRTSFSISNPSRVTRTQRSKIVFESDVRYVPVRRDAAKHLGIIVLQDTRSGEE